MQDSLPAGWLAFAGRGSNPLYRDERFPSCYISFPSPGFILTLLPIRFIEAARTQAKTYKNERNDHPGWLAGLPIAVKDYNDVGGQLTTCGSPLFADHVAAADDRT